MTGGTPVGDFSTLEERRAGFWAEAPNWAHCAHCDAQPVCDHGCVAYHRMSHAAFAQQCQANRLFWAYVQRYRGLLGEGRES